MLAGGSTRPERERDPAAPGAGSRSLRSGAPAVRTSGTGAATSRLRRTWRSMPPGANVSEECWTASPEARCMISSSSSTAVAPLTPSARPTGSRLLISNGRTRVTAKATPMPWLEQDVEHHPAGLDRGADRLLRRQRDARAHDVAHHRDRLAVGQDRARDRPRERIRLGARTPRPARLPSRRSATSRSRTPSATPRRSRELGVGPQHLQPLVERGRAHRLADVRARALAARDLARVREPVQRRAQRST